MWGCVLQIADDCRKWFRQRKRKIPSRTSCNGWRGAESISVLLLGELPFLAMRRRLFLSKVMTMRLNWSKSAAVDAAVQFLMAAALVSLMA